MLVQQRINMYLPLLFPSCLCLAAPGATTIDWTLEPSEAAAETSEKLVSFNLDWHPSDEGPTWGQNASIVTIDLQNQRLRALAKAMSPAVLRIGGSEGDDAVYDMGAACSKSRGGSGVPDPAYCMTVPRWNELLHFAEDTGLSVAFGVNVMYGRNCTTRCTPQPCGAGNTGYGTCSPWDPSNAIALMEYTAAHNLSIGGFEVGNEKEHVLTPKDYASCMQVMRENIDRIWPDPSQRPLLIGPDENPRADWLHEMLDAGGNVADVITYHLYAGYGLDPSLAKELVTPGFLDFTRIIGGDIARVAITIHTASTCAKMSPQNGKTRRTLNVENSAGGLNDTVNFFIFISSSATILKEGTKGETCTSYLGSLQASAWSLIDTATPAKGLVLSYGKGQTFERTEITMLCDPSTDGLDAGPTFLGSKLGLFSFTWNTSHACPL